MNEEQIEELLQRADEAAGGPVYHRPAAARIRRHVRHRWLTRAGVPALAAAVALGAMALSAVGVWMNKPPREPQRIASLEMQVKQLQTQTDAALRLVRGVLEKERRERRHAALAAELASIPDPLEEIEKQLDQTAFTLLYQADRLYQELNQTESAVAAYKEVIQLFPGNRWADVARERLLEIEKHQSSQVDTPGESRWKT